MASVTDSRSLRYAILLALASATIAYLPFLPLPLISDDYLQIDLSRHYGPPSGWADLSADALYRCRATSLVLTSLVDGLFGVSAIAHNALSFAVHLANCFLILLLGIWPRIGFRVSSAAAVFFAVYEGHQEAVVWNAALPELLVFAFTCGAILLWIQWLQSGSEIYLAGSGVAFLLALLSKESAIVAVPVMFFVALVERRLGRRSIGVLAAMSGISVVYALLIFRASSAHLHLNDGTFDWRSPFPLTVANSVVRMLWLWGILAAGVLLAKRSRTSTRFVLACILIMAAALIPYSFLSYMTRVPSRHTYLSSAALAILVGAAFIAVRDQFRVRRQWIPKVALAAFLVHNCVYLWVKKLPQYERRAAPTESLIEFARHESRPVQVRCFPYDFSVAQSALTVALPSRSHRLLAKDAPRQPGLAAVEYCDPSQP